jgi:hypothetical protein
VLRHPVAKESPYQHITSQDWKLYKFININTYVDLLEARASMFQEFNIISSTYAMMYPFILDI